LKDDPLSGLPYELQKSNILGITAAVIRPLDPDAKAPVNRGVAKPCA
jgi:hypothetical protein